MRDHIGNILEEAGEPTLSYVIKYIYGTQNFARMDAFTKANKEIINYLKSKEKEEKINNHQALYPPPPLPEKPLDLSKVPMWNGKPIYKKDVVPKSSKKIKPGTPPKEPPVPSTGNEPTVRKVFDYIVNRKLDYGEILKLDPQFKTGQDIKAYFANLKNSQYAKYIDSIYEKYHLNLPPFSTWRASDLNKGPSDRGELKADSPEYSTDDFGHLSKVRYDKFGQSSNKRMAEFKDVVSTVLNEMTILTRKMIL